MTTVSQEIQSLPGPRVLSGLWRVQAPIAYCAGTMAIQYTIRGVPAELDERLREEARRSGTSVNRLVLDTLRAIKMPSADERHTDLDWFLDSAGDAAAEDVDRVAQAERWLDDAPMHLG